MSFLCTLLQMGQIIERDVVGIYKISKNDKIILQNR